MDTSCDECKQLGVELKLEFFNSSLTLFLSVDGIVFHRVMSLSHNIPSILYFIVWERNLYVLYLSFYV